VTKDPDDPPTEATKKLRAILDNEAPEEMETEDSNAGGINASEQLKVKNPILRFYSTTQEIYRTTTSTTSTTTLQQQQHL